MEKIFQTNGSRLRLRVTARECIAELVQEDGKMRILESQPLPLTWGDFRGHYWSTIRIIAATYEIDHAGCGLMRLLLGENYYSETDAGSQPKA